MKGRTHMRDAMQKRNSLYGWKISSAAAILIYLGFFPFCTLFSQNLTFSQVLNVNNVEDTVPNGKVWKVEALLTRAFYQYGGGSPCASDIDSRQIVRNGTTLYIQGEGVGTGNTTIFVAGYSLPFWFPAGTRLRTQCPDSWLSIIEFNIVP